jgi:Putative prokaryotic signal transducing protein
MELVTVTTVSDAGLANVVVGVLEQAGLAAVVGGPGAPDVYPMPSVHPYRILVNEDDLARARDVLAQYETTPDDADDDD